MLTTIYWGIYKPRKKILEIKIKDFKKIAPYDEFSNYNKNGDIEEVFCGSSKKSPDLYFAEYQPHNLHSQSKMRVSHLIDRYAVLGMTE